MEKKLFKLIDNRDGSNVLGGAVPYESVHISQYAGDYVEGEPLVEALDVGQSTLRYYSMCMTKPTVYRIVRVA